MDAFRCSRCSRKGRPRAPPGRRSQLLSQGPTWACGKRLPQVEAMEFGREEGKRKWDISTWGKEPITFPGTFSSSPPPRLGGVEGTDNSLLQIKGHREAKALPWGQSQFKDSSRANSSRVVRNRTNEKPQLNSPLLPGLWNPSMGCLHLSISISISGFNFKKKIINRDQYELRLDNT